MVIHTFGEYLADFHPHLHALVADGLFDRQGVFHPLPEEIVLWPLEEMFRRRVNAFLVEQELLPRDRAEMLLSWQHSGFSLHRSRRVEPGEREDLEQMARYILRNPFSTAKMHFEPGAGSVLYRSRMNKEQGGNFAALSPSDFIAAVTQHIPDKVSSSCATTAGTRTRPGAFAPRQAQPRTKAPLKAMSRIPRQPPPVAAAHRQDLGSRSAHLPRLWRGDEDHRLHRRGPRDQKNSGPPWPTRRVLFEQASGVLYG